MDEPEPVTELGAFGSRGAAATEWARARGDLKDARVYWLSTVRPDGRPPVTCFGLGDALRGGDALVYRVAPSTAFGFGNGTQLSQTRWRFP